MKKFSHFYKKLDLIRHIPVLKNNVGSIGRLDELEKLYVAANEKVTSVRGIL